MARQRHGLSALEEGVGLPGKAREDSPLRLAEDNPPEVQGELYLEVQLLEGEESPWLLLVKQPVTSARHIWLDVRVYWRRIEAEQSLPHLTSELGIDSLRERRIDAIVKLFVLAVVALARWWSSSRASQHWSWASAASKDGLAQEGKTCPLQVTLEPYRAALLTNPCMSTLAV